MMIMANDEKNDSKQQDCHVIHCTKLQILCSCNWWSCYISRHVADVSAYKWEKEGEGRSATRPRTWLKIQVLPAGAHNEKNVCLFFLRSRFQSLWGMYDPSHGRSPQSHLDCQLQRSEKCSARLTKRQSEEIRSSATKRRTTWLSYRWLRVEILPSPERFYASKRTFEGLIHAEENGRRLRVQSDS